MARAGVDVRARRIGVRARADLAVVRAVAFFLGAVVRFAVVLRAALVRLVLRLAVVRLVARLEVVDLAELRPAVVPLVVRLLAGRLAVLRLVDFVLERRVVERTDPLLFFRDAAAFNCYPLCWIVAPALEQDAQELPGSAFTAEHSSRAGYGRSNSFYPPDP